MRKILIILFVLASIIGEAQVYSRIPGRGSWWDRGQFDSTLKIPSLVADGFAGGKPLTGSIIFYTPDSLVKVYTGNQWIPVGGGTGTVAGIDAVIAYNPAISTNRLITGSTHVSGLDGTGAWMIPTGDIDNRPALIADKTILRYNTTIEGLEYGYNDEWFPIQDLSDGNGTLLTEKRINLGGELEADVEFIGNNLNWSQTSLGSYRVVGNSSSRLYLDFASDTMYSEDVMFVMPSTGGVRFTSRTSDLQTYNYDIGLIGFPELNTVNEPAAQLIARQGSMYFNIDSQRLAVYHPEYWGTNNRFRELVYYDEFYSDINAEDSVLLGPSLLSTPTLSGKDSIHFVGDVNVKGANWFFGTDEDSVLTYHDRQILDSGYFRVTGVAAGNANLLSVRRGGESPLLNVNSTTAFTTMQALQVGNFAVDLNPVISIHGVTQFNRVGGEYAIVRANQQPHIFTRNYISFSEGGSDPVGLRVTNDTTVGTVWAFPDSGNYRPLELEFQNHDGYKSVKFYVNGRGNIWSAEYPHASDNDSILVVENGIIKYRTAEEIGTGEGGVSDHGALTGLGDDDHTIYALLAGRSGGQTLIGGTAADNILTFQGNSAAASNTDGNVNMTFKSGNSGGFTAMQIYNSGVVTIGTPTYDGNHALIIEGTATSDGDNTRGIKYITNNGTVNWTMGYSKFTASANYTWSASGVIDIQTTSTNDITLSPGGNVKLTASKYFNWGSTSGSSGYGIWDDGGTMKFKNSGGSWTAFGGSSDHINTSNGVSLQSVKIGSANSSWADNDEAYLSGVLDNDAGTETEFGRIYFVGTDINAGTNVDGAMDFGLVVAGSMGKKLRLTGTTLVPFTAGLLDLGTTTLPFNELFVQDGIDFSNDIQITRTGTNTLKFENATIYYIDNDFLPFTNNNIPLGSFDRQWSELNLGEGAAIKWDNTDFTFTQSGNTGTFAGGGVIMAAGTSSQAGLVLTSGTDESSVSGGELEYNGSRLSIAISTTRKRIAVFADGTPANGSLFYGNGADFSTLAVGTSGQYLTVSGGLPAWADNPGFTPVGFTTTDATPQTIATISPALGETGVIEVSLSVIKTNGDDAVTGKKIVRYKRTSGGTLTLGTIDDVNTTVADGSLSTASWTITTSGSTVIIQFTGVAATNTNGTVKYVVTKANAPL